MFTITFVLIISQDIYSFEDGRTALHYAAAIAGIPGGNREYYDVLIESGAKEHLIDAEGYTADHYKRNPALIDMIQVKGINMCKYSLEGPKKLTKLSVVTDINGNRPKMIAFNLANG